MLLIQVLLALPRLSLEVVVMEHIFLSILSHFLCTTPLLDHSVLNILLLVILILVEVYCQLHHQRLRPKVILASSPLHHMALPLDNWCVKYVTRKTILLSLAVTVLIFRIILM